MAPEARAAPRATVAPERGALRLVALNRAAAALGLQPGLSLADARARHPALAVAPHAPEADARTLAGFADACERYTPLLALDPPDGLLLDIAGCAHLFGGERGLLRDLRGRVVATGFSARAAIAGTPAAAAAFARFSGRPASLVPEDADLAGVLAPLPLAALRSPPAVEAALARLGFARLGDLMDKPRAPLAARFGADVLARLDALTGAARPGLDHRLPPPRFSAEKALAEPIERSADVLGIARHLAGTLAAALERAGLGARRLDLALFRVDGAVTRLSVGTARPLRDPAIVQRLFAEKVAALGSLDPGFGFDLLRLSAPLAEPLAPHQDSFDAGQADAAALDALVDRLAARLGGGAVTVPRLEDAHCPEAACRLVPAQSARRAAPDRPDPPPPDLAGPARPPRLFDRPELVEAVAEVPDGPPVRFRWRRLLHQVAVAEGPERIAAPWWREPGLSPTRDYFRVETTAGRRLWLFRAGLFGTETAHPAWYVHGLFG
ncbi:protein ImuB [Aquabacter spiritensis]|uniref:Protein ImuB n=1 Tax=Aquabacter spiritensis TaxID=933073 RepID=A0A4R3LY66_9HYPH|nr:protein ImuB [Aquabacter spiritensis]